MDPAGGSSRKDQRRISLFLSSRHPCPCPRRDHRRRACPQNEKDQEKKGISYRNFAGRENMCFKKGVRKASFKIENMVNCK